MLVGFSTGNPSKIWTFTSWNRTRNRTRTPPENWPKTAPVGKCHRSLSALLKAMQGLKVRGGKGREPRSKGREKGRARCVTKEVHSTGHIQKGHTLRGTFRRGRIKEGAYWGHVNGRYNRPIPGRIKRRFDRYNSGAL